MNDKIPSETIHTFARTIIREAADYGFKQLDVIRLVNELMDLCNDSAITNARDRRRSASDRIRSEIASDLPLQGERVRIRECNRESDLDVIRSWLPDRYGRYFVLSCATAQKITVEALLDDEKNRLGIVTDLDDRPIGAMAYLDISREQCRAELRKLIGDPASRGQGLAEEATRLWVDYGQSHLGLEKIYVSTLQTHIGNIKLNEAIGFRVEGVLRNEVKIDGKRFDVLRMGICSE